MLMHPAPPDRPWLIRRSFSSEKSWGGTIRLDSGFDHSILPHNSRPRIWRRKALLEFVFSLADSRDLSSDAVML